MKPARKKTAWISASVAAASLAVVASRSLADGTPSSGVLPANADTHVSHAPPHQNHGGEAELVVGGGQRSRALLGFDRAALSALAAGKRLVAARLELTVTGADRHWSQARREAERTLDLHPVRRVWSESGATWLSPDQAGPHPGSTWDMSKVPDDRHDDEADAHGDGGRDGGWKWGRGGRRDGRGRGEDDDDRGGPRSGESAFEPLPTASAVVAANPAGLVGFDVTQDVLATLGGVEHLGWLLELRDEDGHATIRFSSREGQAPPRLTLTFEVPNGLSLVVVSGDGQRARAGGPSAPLIVEARDARGPLSGVAITFEVASGDAALGSSPTVLTDAGGRAQAHVVLGAATGVVQVRATSPGVVPAAFQIVALPAPTSFRPVADTFVSRILPNTPRGSTPVLSVGPAALDRALVRFDAEALRAEVGGDEVEAAILELTIAGEVQAPGAIPFVLSAHRMRVAWTERGATWNSPDDARPWNRRRDGPTWSMKRPPFPFEAGSSGSVALADDQRGAVDLDVSEDVRALVAASGPDLGWILMNAEERGPGRARFGSREGTAGPWLRLVVRDVTPPVVTVASPEAGACSGPGAILRVEFADARSGILPGSFRALVNGVDRTDRFSIGAGSATCTLGALADALVQGENALEVQVQDLAGNQGATTATVRFDSIAPALTLEPEEGEAVTTDVYTLRVAYSDAGCGVAPSTFTATLNGEPLVFSVGPTEATASIPAGDDGTRLLEVHLADLAGNVATAVRHFQIVRTGTLTGFVGGATLDLGEIKPLANVRVRADTPEAPEVLTDDQGRFVLPRVRLGRPVVVYADGYDQGYGRVALVTSLTTIAPMTSEAADRAWLAPALDAGSSAPLVVDEQGALIDDLTISTPEGARATISAGTRLDLPPGFSWPAGTAPGLTLQRVPYAVIANAIAPPDDPSRRWFAPFFYALQPEGARLSAPVRVSLPNDQGSAPGSSIPYQQFDPALGYYVTTGSLIVSADGSRLEGTIGDFFGPGAPVTLGRAIDVTGELDTGDAPVARALFQSAGAALGVFTTHGLLVFASTVPGPTDPLQPFDLQVTTLVDDAVTYTVTSQTFGPTRLLPDSVNLGGLLVVTSGLNPGLVRSGAPPPGVVRLSVIGRGQAVVSVGVKVNGGPEQLLQARYGSAADDYPGEVAFDVPVGHGPYVVTRLILGSAARITGYSSAKGYVDGLPPTASLSPLGPIFTNQNGVTLTVHATDQLGGVGAIEIERRVPGGSWTRPYAGYYYTSSTSAFGPLQVTVPVPIPRQVFLEQPLVGTFDFRAVVTDAVGLQAVSTPVTVVWDQRPPVFDSVVASPELVRNGPVTISYSAHDVVDQIDRVEVEQNVGGVWTWLTTLYAAAGTFRVPAQFSSRLASFRLIAYDRTGNSTRFDVPGTYVLDSLPPSCSLAQLGSPITDPLGATTVDVPLTGLVTEQGASGLLGWTLSRAEAGSSNYVDIATATLSAPGVVGPTTAAVSVTDQVSDGRWVYRLVARDVAGNETTILSNEVVVDTRAPLLVSLTPASGTVLGPGVFSIVADFEDNLGVDGNSIVVEVDGAKLPVSFNQTRASAVEHTTVVAQVNRVVEGSHVLRVTASDLGGRAVTRTVTFTQDHTPCQRWFVPA